MAGAKYVITARNLASLEVIGEVDVFSDWTHTRRDVEGGSFALTVPLDRPVTQRTRDGEEWTEATEWVPYYPTLLAPGRLIHVTRNGVHEFAGVIEAAHIDATDRRWKFTGPDLLGYFLAHRIAGISTSDDRTGTAEGVMKGYVDDNGGPSAVSQRRFSAELSPGVTWTIEGDAGRGSAVEFAALRRNLLTEVLVPIARAGDVLHTVAIVEGTGYQYRVSSPVTSPSVPFAVSWGNVTEMDFRIDRAGVRNALTVLGPGTGGSRALTQVDDAASIDANGRREGVLDSRDAANAGERTTEGQAEILRREYGRITATVEPSIANTEYGTDYDLGWDVQLSIPEAGVEAETRRIVAVTVSLGGAQGERISIELGDGPPDMGRLLSDAIRRNQRASYE